MHDIMLMQIHADSWFQFALTLEVSHTTLDVAISVVQSSALSQGYTIVIKTRRMVDIKKNGTFKKSDLVR